MTQTPEQMAEEWVSKNTTGSETYEHGLREGFLAGYQAAKDEILSKGMQGYITEIRNDAWCTAMQLGQQSQWISVKDRLPKDGQSCIYVIHIPKKNEWKLDYGEWQAEENVFYGEYLDYRDLSWTLTHWLPLPKPPKEEK